MNKLYKYLRASQPDGIPYSDATQLFWLIFCTLAPLPESLQKERLGKVELGDIFAELARDGLILPAKDGAAPPIEPQGWVDLVRTFLLGPDDEIDDDFLDRAPRYLAGSTGTSKLHHLSKLYQYLSDSNPDGIPFDEAEQLFWLIFCRSPDLPEALQPKHLGQYRLGNIFAQLAEDDVIRPAADGTVASTDPQSWIDLVALFLFDPDQVDADFSERALHYLSGPMIPSTEEVCETSSVYKHLRSVNSDGIPFHDSIELIYGTYIGCLSYPEAVRGEEIEHPRDFTVGCIFAQLSKDGLILPDAAGAVPPTEPGAWLDLIGDDFESDVTFAERVHLYVGGPRKW